MKNMKVWKKNREENKSQQIEKQRHIRYGGECWRTEGEDRECRGWENEVSWVVEPNKERSEDKISPDKKKEQIEMRERDKEERDWGMWIEVVRVEEFEVGIEG
jgi:hypothetical protein